MAKTVVLKSPKQLKPALVKLAKQVSFEIARGMRRTAWWGHGQVLRTARSTKPKPEATQTYIQSWKVKPVEEGAILGNTAYHSYFVEVGRNPGRAPPLKAIIEWVHAKRINAAKMKRYVQSRRKQKDAHVRARKMNKLIRQFAFMVQAKIAREGTKERRVLKRTMPKLQKRAKKETRLAIKAAIAKYKP